MVELRKPALYTTTSGAERPDLARLIGGECLRCGFVFFPFQRLGCEVCGAHDEELSTAILSGRGTLVSCTTVHHHSTQTGLIATSPMPTPFAVATVQLDEGPSVRALLSFGDESTLRPGEPLQAVLAEVPPAVAASTGELDVRFEPLRQVGITPNHVGADTDTNEAPPSWYNL
ncbi:Zn-ribbon domain-containing OB-fold protein [Rhodococcus opacus]|uniref:Zn-ribbon domain-containing OB-fold protein n=1 Tax=Rhodococcus opacus TaxID=37919 RepID=UPI00130E47DD|nr:OB-fold domain-containing protein [Rhodococcus opacus]